MWNLVIWMLDKIPDTISAVETRYCCCSVDKLAPPGPDRINGGVMMPASIASACCSPSSRPRNTGMRSLRPKNGLFPDPFPLDMNGRLGRNRTP